MRERLERRECAVGGGKVGGEKGELGLRLFVQRGERLRAVGDVGEEGVEMCCWGVWGAAGGGGSVVAHGLFVDVGEEL